MVHNWIVRLLRFSGTFTFYESYFSDHKPSLFSLVCPELHFPNASPKLLVSSSIAVENTVTNSDVIITNVNNPSPTLLIITATNDNPLTFTYIMRRALADSINLHHIPIKSTDFTGTRVISMSYNSRTRIEKPDFRHFELPHL